MGIFQTQLDSIRRFFSSKNDSILLQLYHPHFFLLLLQRIASFLTLIPYFKRPYSPNLFRLFLISGALHRALFAPFARKSGQKNNLFIPIYNFFPLSHPKDKHSVVSTGCYLRVSDGGEMCGNKIEGKNDGSKSVLQELGKKIEKAAEKNEII